MSSHFYTVFEIHRKVSFCNIASEASYVYILSGQIVLPDRPILIGQKLVENSTFLVIFKNGHFKIDHVKFRDFLLLLNIEQKVECHFLLVFFHLTLALSSFVICSNNHFLWRFIKDAPVVAFLLNKT